MAPKHTEALQLGCMEYITVFQAEVYAIMAYNLDRSYRNGNIYFL
jgi:hypothetical protein